MNPGIFLAGLLFPLSEELKVRQCYYECPFIFISNTPLEQTIVSQKLFILLKNGDHVEGFLVSRRLDWNQKFAKYTLR